MKNALAGLLLLAALGCKPPKYVEPEPEPIDRPEPPPDRVLRQPVNFSYRTTDGKKEFRLRMYSDEEITDDIVTVIDGGAYERMATKEEFEQAMGEFMRQWVNTGQEDQIQYHCRLFDVEAKRRATLLDDMIFRKQDRIAKLESDRHDVYADAESRRQTGYKEKDKPDILPSLQAEVARLDVIIAAEKARLQLLEYQRYLRDNGDSYKSVNDDIEKMRRDMGNK